VAIRNVIFDFGGVLVSWRPQEIIDAFYADPALRDAVRTQVFEHDDWLEMDRGIIDERTAVERFARRLGRPQSEMAALFEHVRGSLLPIAATVDLVANLRARGFSLYGLSNMSEPIFRHLQARHEFFGLFHGIVISAAIKMVKPDPDIFEHLRARFAIDFTESVFIDDLPRNVASAQRLGLAAIQFESTAQCERELALLL
jgi:putative hydrolase of the HAD superfamily